MEETVTYIPLQSKKLSYVTKEQVPKEKIRK